VPMQSRAPVTSRPFLDIERIAPGWPALFYPNVLMYLVLSVLVLSFLSTPGISPRSNCSRSLHGCRPVAPLKSSQYRRLRRTDSRPSMGRGHPSPCPPCLFRVSGGHSAFMSPWSRSGCTLIDLLVLPGPGDTFSPCPPSPVSSVIDMVVRGGGHFMSPWPRAVCLRSFLRGFQGPGGTLSPWPRVPCPSGPGASSLRAYRGSSG